MADVVRALQVEVVQGNPVYESTSGGFQRLTIREHPTAVVPIDLTQQPIYVVQGNNYFQFAPDERKEAEAFAGKLEAALESLSKSYRKNAANELANLFADKPKKAK